MNSETKSVPEAKRVMVVEDEALTAEDLRDTLEILGFKVTAVLDTGEEAIERANVDRPDIALLDIQLKGTLTGIDVANHLRTKLDIPAVFITAHSDSATLNWAGLAEPFGYIVKPFDENELRATIAMAMFRHRAEKRTRDMEAWLAAALGSIGDAIIATDSSGRITYVNPAAEILTGWSRGQALGKMLREVFVVSKEGEDHPNLDVFNRVSKSGIIFHLTDGYELKTKSGELLPIDDSVAPIREDDGKIIGVVVIFRDRSEAKRSQEERLVLEQKMHESQKMESLGLMAGGIAHDFNNLLTTIQTNASMALDFANTADARIRDSLESIIGASEQAAGLCRQMLAYAGKGRGTVENIDLNSLVEETVRLLHTSTTKVATVSLDLGDRISPLEGDVSQLQQVVMNLLLNAADAMRDSSGSIRLRTRQREVSAEEIKSARIGNDSTPSEYVILEVVDTGCGMSEDVLNRVFDPFFTTKFHGRGLGLATVMGILKSHRTILNVTSKPGRGTKFCIAFPKSNTPVADSSEPQSKREAWEDTGNILVVDDQDSVRSCVEMILIQFGFEVITAVDGKEGLEKFRATPDAFQLVVADLTMPRMNGSEMAAEILKISPQQRILLMSGYSEDTSEDLFRRNGLRHFLQKPFTLSTLGDAVRGALKDSPPLPPPASG